MSSNCFEECEVCLGVEECGRCKEGFYLEGSMCRVCYATCKSCVGGLSTNCLSCPSDYLLNPDKTCRNYCAAGYYVDSQLKCVRCPYECEACNSPDQCIACIANMYLMDYQCLNFCPDKTWNDSGKCSFCDTKCKTCDGPAASNCLECADAYYSIDGVCTRCDEGTYYNEGQCKPCNSICKACVTSSACSECSEGKVLNESGECETQNCLDGYFKKAGVCMACPDLCTSCNDAEECDACVQGARIESRECKCLEGYNQAESGCCILYTLEKIENTQLVVRFDADLSSALERHEVMIALNTLTP